MGKRTRTGDSKDSMTDKLFLSPVFAFFSLRDLCAWCPRVCAQWRDCVYSDARWRVLDTKKLQIWDDAKLLGLASRRFSLVQEIYISSTNLTGSTLPLLVAQCPALKKLHVRQVTVNHLLHTTAHCTNLSSLHFPFFHESTAHDVIKILSCLPSLQHFHFDYFVPVDVVKYVNQTYKEDQILTFKATYPVLDKHTITAFLQKFKVLQQLTLLTANGIDDDVISNLGPSLRSLNIIESSYELTDIALTHISHTCTNLEKLAIGGIFAGEDLRHHKMDKVTDAGLTALSKLPKLKIFVMSHCHFSPEGIQRFMRARRDSLRRLDLVQIPCITDGVFINMARNALNIEQLRLNCINITFGGFEMAAHFLPNLRKVSFTWCPVLTDPLPSEQKVVWGQKIESLHLDSCENLRDHSLMRIATMCGPTLRTFKIECSNHVNDVSLISLSKHCVKLRKFSASENHALTDSSYAQLVANCKSTLEKVQLQETHAGNLTDEAIATYGIPSRILNTGQLYL